MGSTGGTGICHSYAPDGRCISLLKVLLTNVCLYDCHYCINRRSSSVQRARFTPDEVVQLTLDFYKRNYIEGLFPQRGIIKSRLHDGARYEVARKLREELTFAEHPPQDDPEASPDLIAAQATTRRISLNVELPRSPRSTRSAGEEPTRTQEAMGSIRNRIDERSKSHQAAAEASASRQVRARRCFVARCLERRHDAQLTGVLYRTTTSPRVLPGLARSRPSKLLPSRAALVREHRLYQAIGVRVLRLRGRRAHHRASPDSTSRSTRS